MWILGLKGLNTSIVLLTEKIKLSHCRTENQSWCEKSSLCLILPIIAFVRTYLNLGVPVVQSHKFSKLRGRLPISRLY